MKIPVPEIFRQVGLYSCWQMDCGSPALGLHAVGNVPSSCLLLYVLHLRGVEDADG